MAVDESSGPGAGKPAEQRFHFREVYLKDASFEAPHVPGILYSHPEPLLAFDAHHHCRRYLEARDEFGEVFEVILRLTVQATADDRVIFAAEVQQAGLFEIKGYRDDEVDRLLRVRGAEALYPYAKEAVASLVGRCGFQRLMLYPIDFEARYDQLMADHRKAIETPSAEASASAN